MAISVVENVNRAVNQLAKQVALLVINLAKIKTKKSTLLKRNYFNQVARNSTQGILGFAYLCVFVIYGLLFFL